MLQYKIEVMVMMPDNTWHLQTIEFQQFDEGDEKARQEALRLCKENYEDITYVDMSIYSFASTEAEPYNKVWAVFCETEYLEFHKDLEFLGASEAAANDYIARQGKHAMVSYTVEEWSVWS